MSSPLRCQVPSFKSSYPPTDKEALKKWFLEDDAVPEENCERQLERWPKVESSTIQQYSNCTRAKEWRRLLDEVDTASKDYDEDTLEAKWIALVSNSSFPFSVIKFVRLDV